MRKSWCYQLPISWPFHVDSFAHSVVVTLVVGCLSSWRFGWGRNTAGIRGLWSSNVLPILDFIIWQILLSLPFHVDSFKQLYSHGAFGRSTHVSRRGFLGQFQLVFYWLCCTLNPSKWYWIIRVQMWRDEKTVLKGSVVAMITKIMQSDCNAVRTFQDNPQMNLILSGQLQWGSFVVATAICEIELFVFFTAVSAGDLQDWHNNNLPHL